MVKKKVRRSSSMSVPKTRVSHSSKVTMRQTNVRGFAPYAFGNALGLLSIISLVFYGVLTWFGGYNPSVIVAQYPLTFAFNDWTFLLGIVVTYVIAYIGGWIFARIYNRFI